MCEQQREAVVIGGGAAGMSAALLLARAGRKVSLLEAGPALAPLLRGFSRAGLHFDTGFHCAGTLEKGGALAAYLGMLGLLPHLSFRSQRKDSRQLFRFVNASGEAEFQEEFSVPQGFSSTKEAFAKKWPEHATSIANFFQALNDSYEHSRFVNPELGDDTPFISPGLMGQSIEALLAPNEMPGRLKSLLLADSLFYGVAPSQMGANEFSLVSCSMMRGVSEIIGGGRALVHAFEKELLECGVAVKSDSIVTGINVNSSGAVTSVEYNNGKMLPCKECVYTGHPSQLPKLLPRGALRPSMLRHLETIEDTPAAFLLFASSKSAFAANRQVFLCQRDKLEDAYSGKEFAQSWITISAGTPNEEGEYPLVMATILPAGDDADLEELAELKGKARYNERKKILEEQIICKIKKFLPELADIRLLGSATGHTMRKWIYGSRGGVYGVKHSLSQTPIMPRTKVSGLVLAGQGIILPGLLGTIVSAVVAVGLLNGFERIFEELKCASAE